MSDATAGGSIYDLGYQHYTGPRLGRRHAILSLYDHSLRGVFGIGRPISSKIAPMVLFVIALLPAIVQLGIASVSSGEVDILEPQDYYGFIQFVLAIFVAVVAPEIAGRDQRTQTLSLYFSRALLRQDYALAKYAATITAMLSLTFVPQLVLFLGNGVAGNDLGGYIEDQWSDIPAALASAILISALLGGAGLAIAAQTPRRAYSTVGIIAFVVITSILGQALLESIDGDAGRYSLLISPLELSNGLTYWFFGVTPHADEPIGTADIWEGYYAIAALAVSLVALLLTLRRYRSVQA